jgi:hypothetical protein
MLSCRAGQAYDGVAVDTNEAAGLSDAVALGQVIEDGDGRGVGKTAPVEGRALALGEAGAADIAVELSELLVLAEVAADREVGGAAEAVEGAVGILAAEAREVVHGAG